MIAGGFKSILVLDSGIGGMTVVKGIRKLNPDLSIHYIADRAFFPYGQKTEDALIARLKDLVAQALDCLELDAIVIACNTASTLALDALRAAFSIPFVGVVPPIKTAGEISRSRAIGLLATEGTVETEYLGQLVTEYAPDCTVLRVACPGLAQIAEDKVRGLPVQLDDLRQILTPFNNPEYSTIDVVVLGCTHYPILLTELEEVLPQQVTWLEPAIPVARQLAKVLKGENKEALATNPTRTDIVYFTGDEPLPREMSPFLEENGFFDLAYWPTPT